MVMEAKKNSENPKPQFEFLPSKWTAREALAIRRAGVVNSLVIRSLIDPQKLAALVKQTESAAVGSRLN